MAMNEARPPVKSADRTLELLEALAAGGPRGLVELARELDIPKSSLHGLLRTMTKRGWVQTDATGTRFGLGVRALQVGAAYLDSDDTLGLVNATLDALAERFGETVHLGRLDGPNVVYIAKRESAHPLRLFSAIGRRLPAHATALGKALLAQRPDAEVDRLLDWPLLGLTPHTLTTPEALHANLAKVREHGWAEDREENTEGIMCLAVALPLHRPAVDAISVSVPLARLRNTTAADIVADLHRHATHLQAAAHLLP
jgi:DNA-binding IclR family transcriptional regulator